MNRKWLSLFLVLGLAFSFGLVTVTGCSQTQNNPSSDPASPPSGTTTIEVASGGQITVASGSDTGTASFVVVDQNGAPINSTNYLNAANITIQVWSTTTITSQAATVGTLTYTGGSTGDPISYALTLDRSGSMYYSDLVSMESAALAFIANTGTADEGMVINFSTNVAVDQGLTTNKSLLSYAVTNESVAADMTALYRSINVGTATLDASAANTRKAVIAMTDGGNNQTPTDINDPIGKAQAAGIPVYTVGLGSGISATNLQQIATDTGGLFYSAPTAADLVDLYNKISTALNSTWSITFTSPVTFTTSTTYYILVTITYPGVAPASTLYTVTL
ncbi:MAG: VWA domain-containing protein [Candidatus Margulisbacteria bacterium]|nr:VWA domain-containing protein [Candidatus Margulisiibacteriota bacterium]